MASKETVRRADGRDWNVLARSPGVNGTLMIVERKGQEEHIVWPEHLPMKENVKKPTL